MGISDLDPDAHGRRPWNAGGIAIGYAAFVGDEPTSVFEAAQSINERQES
jgi:hypothetical protein